MRNLRLDICYDGTRYRGWQRLPGRDDTIQGKLETALSRILEESIEVSGSGRTDAGVHALHQAANFHCESAMPDIGAIRLERAEPRFHARLNARAKTYRYRIWNSREPCVFQRRYVAVMPERLDLNAMRRGAALLTGEHDFSAFCGNARMKKSTVRRIDFIDIQRQGEEIQILFTGNGFLYNMVRILVGTLVEVGRGERETESIPSLFGGKREDAGFLAPAQGLCLMEVVY